MGFYSFVQSDNRFWWLWFTWTIVLIKPKLDKQTGEEGSKNGEKYFQRQHVRLNTLINRTSWGNQFVSRFYYDFLWLPVCLLKTPEPPFYSTCAMVLHSITSFFLLTCCSASKDITCSLVIPCCWLWNPSSLKRLWGSNPKSRMWNCTGEKMGFWWSTWSIKACD